MTQLSFYLDPKKLRQGRTACPCCGKLMRSYCKTLDKRLVNLAYGALKFLLDHHKESFRVREVFTDHQHINDFQKLGYWGIFRRTGGRWEATQTTLGFLTGGWALPKRLWVFNHRVVEESEERVRAEEVSERWQQMRSDYALDYKSRPFNKNVELIPALL